jgi:N-acetylglucosamine-6-phosphate deacetylase
MDREIGAIVGNGAIPSHALRHEVSGLLVAPGFIDTQVNGGGGALFNDDPSVETIRTIGEAHRRFGTTGFLPTLISDELTVIARAIGAVAEAIRQGVPGVLGIHIEGPFLNMNRRGIHDPAYIRPLDEEAFALISGNQVERTLVTLAPEQTTPQTITRLCDAGVIVAAGHTEATYDEMRAGYAAGITGMTHLFNAMSPMASRAPGAVGAALSTPSIYCGIIVDGIHVHPATLRVALQSGPIERFMLVTDAMPPAGLDSGGFRLNGKEIFVENGRCVDSEGVLAGSVLTMADAVRNSVDMLGLSTEQALRLASASSAAFLGLADRGRLAPGMTADLAVLDMDLKVVETWIAGVRYA